jgi:hypothetical protein
MNVNDISEIVELDETFHILKITELNKFEAMPMEQMKESILQELINSESMALMNDEYEIIDEMIFSGSDIDTISASLSKNLLDKKDLSQNNFDFEFNDPNIRNFIFSPESSLNIPNIFNSGDSIVVMQIVDIIEPSLQELNIVMNKVNENLSEQKTNEKINLLISELTSAKEENSLSSFLNAYDFISQESFIDITRYSSLLPKEVVSEIFNILPGNSVTLDAFNGDKYFIDVLNFSEPNQDSIKELYDQYKVFSENRVSKNLTDIISKELYDTAKVNITSNIIL